MKGSKSVNLPAGGTIRQRRGFGLLGLALAVFALARPAPAIEGVKELKTFKDLDTALKAAKKFSDLENLLVGGGATKCEKEPVATGNLFSNGALTQLLLSRVKCRELLTMETPDFVPGWVTDWWPACSRAYWEEAKARCPDCSPQKLIDRVEKEEADKDLCARGPSSVRGGTGFHPPSQKDRGVERVMDAAEKEAFEKGEFAGVRARATDDCCGKKDTDCRDLMDQVKLKWCEPQKDMTKEDSCLTSGANFSSLPGEGAGLTKYFNDVDALFKNPDQVSLAAKMKAANERLSFPFFSGRIELPPFKWKSYQVTDWPGTYYHEFGHACSSIRSQLAATRGEVASYYRLYALNRGIGSCNLDPLWNQSYDDVFRRTGASPETQSCVKRIAENARDLNFVPLGKCELNVCPKQYLEEAFGEWQRAMGVPDEDFVVENISRTCSIFRDLTHPMGMDTTRCFLKSQIFEDKFRRGTKCKP